MSLYGLLSVILFVSAISCIILAIIFLYIMAKTRVPGEPLNLGGVSLLIILGAFFGVLKCSMTDPNELAATHDDYTYLRHGQVVDYSDYNLGNYHLIVDDETRTVEIRDISLFGL